MKQFVFNQCSVCVNPNIIERTGDNHDEFRISTAEHEGKWGVGISYFYNLGGMSYGVSQSSCIFESEVSAILHGVSVIRKHLKTRQAQSTKLFKQLNEIAPQSLQLSLF